MKYLLLVFVIIGAVDCALGWYLDSRMRPLSLPNGALPTPRNYIQGRDGFIRLPDGSIPDGSFVIPPHSGDVLVFSDGSTLRRDAATESRPKLTFDSGDLGGHDAANTLAQRGGDPMQTNLYATYTNATQYGIFRNQNGWWQFAWNGHATPLIAPSWR